MQSPAGSYRLCNQWRHNLQLGTYRNKHRSRCAPGGPNLNPLFDQLTLVQMEWDSESCVFLQERGCVFNGKPKLNRKLIKLELLVGGLPVNLTLSTHLSFEVKNFIVFPCCYLVRSLQAKFEAETPTSRSKLSRFSGNGIGI